MARTKAAVTQNELTGYAKAMHSVGCEDWGVKVTKPDGTTVVIYTCRGGVVIDDGDEIDRMIDRA